MKKMTLTIFTILILTLTACGAATNENNPVSVNRSTAASAELPVATQLVIGTLKLEETESAVTAEQASELLPLWRTLQVLSASDTAADQEMEALMVQIQETMTAEQMQAITAMSLTRQDMFSIMQEQGLAMGAGPTGAQNNSSQSVNPSGGGVEFARGGGPPPDGGFPGGGPGFAGQGQNLSEDQIATAQAARQENSGSVAPPMLINALIEYLQEKAGS